MLVSCIIPTRNRSEMVLGAIASIVEQDHVPLEIIVVDDGSTDDTAVAVRAMFPEVRLIRLNGKGPGPARNAGAAFSKGDILMFLDSDDIWLNGHVTGLLDTLGRGFQVAYGITENIDEIGNSTFLIPEKGAEREGDCFDSIVKWCFLVPSAVAVRREAYQAVNGFDDVDCGEDWIFFIKLAARYPFGWSGPEPITRRRLHKGSLCFLNDRQKLLAMTSQLFILLEKEPRATASQRDRLRRLHEWTATSTDQWSTVQDWHMAMQREKII